MIRDITDCLYLFYGFVKTDSNYQYTEFGEGDEVIDVYFYNEHIYYHHYDSTTRRTIKLEIKD